MSYSKFSQQEESMNDYRVHVYNRPTNTSDNIYVLAGSREKAIVMVEELYPDWQIQAVFTEDNW